MIDNIHMYISCFCRKQYADSTSQIMCKYILIANINFTLAHQLFCTYVMIRDYIHTCTILSNTLCMIHLFPEMDEDSTIIPFAQKGDNGSFSVNFTTNCIFPKPVIALSCHVSRLECQHLKLSLKNFISTVIAWYLYQTYMNYIIYVC